MSNRNATATWSGFSHQGQVGLLLALIELQKGGIDKLKTFVEFESREDIAIYTVEDEERIYKSVHQVKAYYSSGSRQNDYLDVFRGMPVYEKGNDGKYIKIDGKKKATGEYESGQWCDHENFLHTVKKITDWNDANGKTMDKPPVSIKRFLYPDQEYYCDTDNVSSLIKEELKKILKADEGRVNDALNRLTYVLDKKVREEHRIKKGKKDYNIVFSLEEFIHIINDNSNYFKQTIFECRRLFYDLFLELTKEEKLEEEHEEKLLNRIVIPIYNMDDSDFFKFLQNLSLNETERNLESTHVVFNRTGLEDVFFEILFNVISEIPELNEDLFLKYSSRNYIFSTIASSKGKKIVQNLLSNLKSHKLLWEGTSIINKEINGSFYELNPDFFDISNQEEKEQDFKDFMQYNKSTKLICKVRTQTNLTNGKTD